MPPHHCSHICTQIAHATDSMRPYIITFGCLLRLFGLQSLPPRAVWWRGLGRGLPVRRASLTCPRLWPDGTAPRPQSTEATAVEVESRAEGIGRRATERQGLRIDGEDGVVVLPFQRMFSFLLHHFRRASTSHRCSAVRRFDSKFWVQDSSTGFFE